MTNRTAALLATLLLVGCTPPDFKLIDQRTFRRTPTPNSTEVAGAALPSLPLVVIRYDNLDEDYGPSLGQAVDAATALKPDVSFDVLTPMPIAAPPDVQARFTRQGISDAQDVANTLVIDGVPPDRIHMGFRGDSGNPPREVQVYAR